MLQNSRPAFRGDDRGTLGGGGSQPTPPPVRPPFPPFCYIPAPPPPPDMPCGSVWTCCRCLADLITGTRGSTMAEHLQFETASTLLASRSMR